MGVPIKILVGTSHVVIDIPCRILHIGAVILVNPSSER